MALADYGRGKLLSPIDLENYGTARMIRGSCNAPREVVAYVRIPWGTDSHQVPVELLPEEIAEVYERLGLRLADSSSSRSLIVTETIEDAASRFILQMPGLAASVASLTRVIHVLVSSHDDYDTSHSDPALPFSVFISVPFSRRADAPLRVAESLIHETMHLQLSLLERLVPLIDPTLPSVKTYSPWRGTYREAGGILHALYVFRVIEQFWAVIARNNLDTLSTRFAASRRAQIEVEIKEIADFQHSPSLTHAGRSLVSHLLKGVVP